MNTYGYEMVHFSQDTLYDKNGVKLLSSGVMTNRERETALLLELENTTGSVVYLSTSDINRNASRPGAASAALGREAFSCKDSIFEL
nr:hypothetical protein [Pseudoflavonifractor phocaeensis]